jgi:hypothetical protein
MNSAETDKALRTLVTHAWDHEITWGQISAWAENFSGRTTSQEVERAHGLTALSRFIYFGKRLVREMLRSLYRDHFEAPTIQRIRRNARDTRDNQLLRETFKRELASTRFIGVGNPSESGARLLYYFRQINHLSKDLFVDLGSAFISDGAGSRVSPLRAVDPTASRYIFFDDLVGSAQQAKNYLAERLARIRQHGPDLDLRFMSLFATTKGLEVLNEPKLFAGKASCLFELDETYRAFRTDQRYFPNSLGPEFDLAIFQAMSVNYGATLYPNYPLGYRDGQLMIGFTHNTPDNTLPIFWNEGNSTPWTPMFVRYDKVY